jgi:hypothetical protein
VRDREHVIEPRHGGAGHDCGGEGGEEDEEMIMTTSDWILLATLAVIIWYSWETPFFALIYNENKELVLKNEGRGMAYNVTIEPIILGSQVFEFGHLKTWYYCGSGETRKLHLTISYINKSTRILSPSLDSFLNAIAAETDKKTVDFLIKFNSRIKNRSQQKIILKLTGGYLECYDCQTN